MRKKILIVFILTAALSLSACRLGGQPKTNNSDQSAAEVVTETGRVVDLSVMQGQTVTTTPGDVLSVKFSGKDKNREYSLANVDAASYLSLKDHQVASDQKTGEKTATWLFKVEKTGQFSLTFNYGQAGKKVEKTFTYNIVSQ